MELNRHTITYGTNSSCSNSSRIFILWRATTMYKELQETNCIHFTSLFIYHPKISPGFYLLDLFKTELGEEILLSCLYDHHKISPWGAVEAHWKKLKISTQKTRLLQTAQEVSMSVVILKHCIKLFSNLSPSSLTAWKRSHIFYF